MSTDLATILRDIERDGAVPFHLAVDDTALWLAWHAATRPEPLIRLLELARDPRAARARALLDWYDHEDQARLFAAIYTLAQCANDIRRACPRVPTPAEITRGMSITEPR